MGVLSTLRSFLPTTTATPQASSPTEVQGTRWRGASRTLRSMMNWLPGLGSATSDLPAGELRTLRTRSRDAMRSQPVARAAITRSRTNIVGTGLMCRPSVDHETLGLSPDEAEVLNGQLRKEFERWAESSLECDQEAAFDFYGLQSLALMSAMSSGDVFALTPYEARPGCVHQLKVQLIEADRISNPNDAPDSPSCIDGIQIQGGRPVGCWVRNTHPGDALATLMPAWAYYPFVGANTGRKRVLHVWNDKERPGQVRGAPYLAPVLEPLRLIERFSGAELMAAVVSAMLTVFITRDPEVAGGDDDAGALPDDGSGNVALGNAAVVDLAPGETPHEVNPARPNSKFDPFFMAVVKQIGAALELPVDELLLHYQSSYSAARAAMLQAWRFYTLRRWYLTQQFCQPCYALVIDEAVAAGRLRLPRYGDAVMRSAYLRALWIGPARGAMDELKEARAAEVRINTGLSNEAMETAALTGEDWRDVYDQRVREIKRRKADGTWLAPRDSAGRELNPVTEPDAAAGRKAEDEDELEDEAA